MSLFFYIAGFSLFLMATFVNDFNIDGFPAFYLIWLTIVIFRLLMEIDFHPVELLSQFILFFLLQPSFFVEFFNSEGVYMHGYLFSVLYINVIFMIPYFMSNTKFLRVVVALVLAVMALISLLSIIQGSRRTTIYFGPNVLYRVYGLLFALFLLSYFFERKYFLNRSFFWIVFIMFVTGLIATGSRGAIVVFSVPLIYLLLRKGAFKIKTRHVLFALLPALAALFYFVMNNFDLFWRMFYFDFENESIVARLEYFSTTMDYMSEISLNMGYMFGLSSSNYLWDNYPHNFIMESFVYGGVWLTLIVMLPLLMFVYKSLFSRDKIYIILFFVYLPVFIGASFSGDLTYNFPIISVPFVAVVYMFSCNDEPYMAGVSGISDIRWRGLVMSS